MNLMEKIKGWLQIYGHDLWLCFLIIGIGFLGFGLGKISVLEARRVPIKIVEPPPLVIKEVDQEIGETTKTKGNYVASRNSNKYHLPSCSGAKNIKVENQIWFQTKTEAEKAGFVPAGNCPGL